MAFVSPLPNASSAGLRGAMLRAPATCSARSNTEMALATDAPPESRVAPYYPAKGRHLAPFLNLQNVEGFELMNKIGLNFVEAPLDLASAAELRASFKFPFLSEETGFNFADLFCSESTDPAATSVVDRHFPPARRYEVPIIELTGGDEDECNLTVSLGHAFVDTDLDDTPVEEAAAPTGMPSAVRAAYGDMVRNKAPVIEFGSGELSISVSVQDITGEPGKSLYPAKFDNCAPEILMKRPAFDDDISAFISVGSEEVQLELNGKF